MATVQVAVARDLGELGLPGTPHAELLSAVTGTAVLPEGGATPFATRLRLSLLTEWERTRLDMAVDLQGSHAASEVTRSTPLPGSAETYRVRSLNTELGEALDAEWYTEVDRAAVEFELDPDMRLTIGRQAVGLGRGVLFSAIDVFAPFSPLDIDREWRRGVDAMRLELGLGNAWSVEAITVWGHTWDDSAVLAHTRGHSSRMDAELIVGKRRRDVMLGAAVSAPVGGAEIHAETAASRTDDDSGFQAMNPGRWVLQTVIGGSYTFAVGQGLTLLIEHHGNGFGDEDIKDGLIRLASSPEYQDRLIHGDTRIMGRQAAALQLSYPVSLECSAAVRWLINPDDGSGLITPYLSWAPGARTAVLFSVTIPHGAGGSDRWGIPETEYGATALTAFLQVRIYD